ncbi:hypothetical protein AXG93_2798s1030 [Marchantia polymorpha subsp. ruderalis]|uniref:Uncharacterized protein n=1 Tax=Marchantia polymorpha subsp. ruderalis TaxID=1480154 RepID=A0A176VU48_MARPO|nr:hypothetical protein AXG93_2798s1030 [Marchantia polymorpha subsp. ruderalis]
MVVFARVAIISEGKQVDAKLAELKNIEADHLGDDSGLAAYFKLESARLIQYIKSLPDVAGIHFMPVTPSGWRQFSSLLDDQRPTEELS